MTLVAGEVRVGTGIVFYFLSLLCVARKAFRGEFAFQGNVQRGMRVSMTAPTVFQFIMRCIAMAHAALWNSAVTCGRMFYVTVLTSNLCLVFGPFFRNSLRLLRMTIPALSVSYGL
jgi:hypothetical protein